MLSLSRAAASTTTGRGTLPRRRRQQGARGDVGSAPGGDPRLAARHAFELALRAGGVPCRPGASAAAAAAALPLMELAAAVDAEELAATRFGQSLAEDAETFQVRGARGAKALQLGAAEASRARPSVVCRSSNAIPHPPTHPPTSRRVVQRRWRTRRRRRPRA